MSLAKKYNIPAEIINKMVKEGKISASVVYYEEVYDLYKEKRNMSLGKSDTQIFYEIVDEITSVRLTPESVKKIVWIMGKRS